MSNSTPYFKIHKQSLMLLFFCAITMACGVTYALPTRTPIPTLTPTPVFLRRSGEQLVRAIRAANLDIEDVHPLNPENDSLLAPGAGQGFGFSMPSLCAGCRGKIFSFNHPAAMEKAKTHFTDGQAEQSFWIFAKDNILLQLDGRLSKVEAKAYGGVLVQLR